MYAHATTSASLRARRGRRRTTRRPTFFLRRTTPHVRARSTSRAASASCAREIARITAALASVAAWTAVAYLAR